jgi:hypothetical protein
MRPVNHFPHGTGVRAGSEQTGCSSIGWPHAGSLVAKAECGKGNALRQYTTSWNRRPSRSRRLRLMTSVTRPRGPINGSRSLRVKLICSIRNLMTSTGSGGSIGWCFDSWSDSDPGNSHYPRRVAFTSAMWHWRPCSLPISIVIPTPWVKRIRLYGRRREWSPDRKPHRYQKSLQFSNRGRSFPESQRQMVYESRVRTW